MTLTTTAARELVGTAIARVAPDADVASLADETELRDEVGLDSLDFLSLVELLTLAQRDPHRRGRLPEARDRGRLRVLPDPAGLTSPVPSRHRAGRDLRLLGCPTWSGGLDAWSPRL